MKDYIKYEDMPPSAQKAYDSTNSARKVAMFIGGAGFIVAAISLLIASLFDSATATMIFVPTFYISIIPGLVHANLHFKKLIKTGLIGLVIWLFAVLIVGIFGSLIFLAIDIILYIMKKPLISKSEHHFFMETPAAQQEMMAMAIAELGRQSDSSDAAESLRQLKEMLDSGLITEEEFSAKKAELLERM